MCERAAQETQMLEESGSVQDVPGGLPDGIDTSSQLAYKVNVGDKSSVCLRSYEVSNSRL